MSVYLSKDIVFLDPADFARHTKDIITAYATMTGIIRAGMTALLLSPRNSTSALAHLMATTKCRMIVHSTDKFITDTLSETLSLVREAGGSDIPLFHLPSYGDTYGKISEDIELLDRPSWVNSDTVAFIGHTSGGSRRKGIHHFLY